MIGDVIRIPTPDGAKLAAKRRPCAGGAPVLLVHGLGMNADLWNFPDVRGPDYEYRSLASLLHEAGFDVWLLNLRGHGRPHMLSEPPAGQRDWSVDHFILYDLPAAVAFVREATGLRPFVLGSSMGAMTLAGMMQGATPVDGDARIVADAELAMRRGTRDVAGCVFVEFPAALRWPVSLYNTGGGLNWTQLLNDRAAAAEGNYPFEVLARSAWAIAILDAVGALPLTWVRPTTAGAKIRAALPGSLRTALEKIERGVAGSIIRVTEMLAGQSNDRIEVMLHGWRYTLDHLKAGVMRQFAQCVRDGNFASTFGTPRHVYSDHYSQIVVPALVLAGGRDRIAHPQVTRELFFEQIASEDKQFRLYENLNHGDFEATPAAMQQVYPDVLHWLTERRDRARD